MSMLKLGPVRQIGYVVRDVEKAMQTWVNLGVGPWFLTRPAPVENFQYMGKPVDTQFAAAISNSGYVQIELIEQLNDGPSMYRDFLAGGAEGIQHVSHWVEDFDRASQILLDLGYVNGQSGNIGPNGRFAYYVHQTVPGTVIEISEFSGFKGEVFKAIAEQCAHWDGSNPIRR